MISLGIRYKNIIITILLFLSKWKTCSFRELFTFILTLSIYEIIIYNLYVFYIKLLYDTSFSFSLLFNILSFFMSWFDFFLPNIISAKSPENTKTAPNHCRDINVFPKNITENSTVKNFLVVVTTEQANGPKCCT